MSTFIAMLLSALLLSGTVVAAPVKVLRVCADPDNMPFSSANPSERGLYVELADLIAARLGVPTEYFWWASYFGKRTVRSTLLSDRCAAYFGLPSDSAFMGKRLLLTRPFLHVGYAIMAPAALRIAQLDDLKGKTVGVEFRTGPHILLASQDDFQVSTFRRAEEVLEALRRGEVETAFVWGPMAGYYNTTRLGSAYQIIPVAGPGLQWQVAIGVKPGNEVLKEALERELEHLQPQILRLAEQYGFPLTTPVRLEARLDGTPPAARRPTVTSTAQDQSLSRRRQPHPRGTQFVQSTLRTLPFAQCHESGTQHGSPPLAGAVPREYGAGVLHDREPGPIHQRHASVGRHPECRHDLDDPDVP